MARKKVSLGSNVSALTQRRARGWSRSSLQTRVRGVPSRGRSHRDFGDKSHRTHQEFSDLELALFLILEWQPDSIESRKQFPLQQEVTMELAENACYRPPICRMVFLNTCHPTARKSHLAGIIPNLLYR